MNTVLRYPGSKWRIADQLVSNIPEHKSYLEPYFGSGAVLFNKPPSPIETINDLDDERQYHIPGKYMILNFQLFQKILSIKLVHF